MAIIANGQVAFQEGESGSVTVEISGGETAIVGFDVDQPNVLEVLTRGGCGYEKSNN